MASVLEITVRVNRPRFVANGPFTAKMCTQSCQQEETRDSLSCYVKGPEIQETTRCCNHELAVEAFRKSPLVHLNLDFANAASIVTKAYVGMLSQQRHGNRGVRDTFADHERG